MVHSFKWMKMLSLLLLLCNTILSLGKKESHRTMSGKYGGCEMTLSLFLSRNSQTEKADWTGAFSLYRILSPSFHFLLIFATHFSADALRCQGSSKFIIHISVNVEKIEHSPHIWVNLSCPSAWWWLPVPLRHLLLGFWVVPLMFICQNIQFCPLLLVGINAKIDIFV